VLTCISQTNPIVSTHQQHSVRVLEVHCDITKDLWKAAADKLDEKSKSAIENSVTGDENIIEALEISLRQIIRQREEHNEQTRKHEEKTIKMLQSVMAFQDLVSAGLIFDPTGYGEERINYY
jgi:hypothetical protein